MRAAFESRDARHVAFTKIVALGATATLCLSGSPQAEAFAEAPLQFEVAKVHLAPEPEPPGPNLDIPWLPETVMEFKDHIIESGEKHGVDPNLIGIIMTLESGGWIGAESPVDAQGLMQIWPPTEEFIAAELGYTLEDYNIYDPKTNIEFGAWYLSYVAKSQNIDLKKPLNTRAVRLISAGYNGGPGRATDLRKADLNYGHAKLPRETELYSKFAATFYQQKDREESTAFQNWRRPREHGGFGGHKLIEKAQLER